MNEAKTRAEKIDGALKAAAGGVLESRLKKSLLNQSFSGEL